MEQIKDTRYEDATHTQSDVEVRNRSSREEKKASRDFNADMREKISQLIKDHNLTIKKLAEELKINPSTFNKYFSGTKFPCDVVASIAQYFGVSVDYLFGINGFNCQDSSKDISLSLIGFPQSAIDEFSHLDLHSIDVLSELLENGIMQQILDVFATYKEYVSSLCTAYAITRSCDVASQAIRTEAERMGGKSYDPQEIEQRIEADSNFNPYTYNDTEDDQMLGYTAFLLWQSSGKYGLHKNNIRQQRFIDGYQLTELLTKYGQLSFQQLSAKTIREKVYFELCDIGNIKQIHKNFVFRSVGKLPIEQFCEEFRPNI